MYMPIVIGNAAQYVLLKSHTALCIKPYHNVLHIYRMQYNVGALHEYSNCYQKCFHFSTEVIPRLACFLLVHPQVQLPIHGKC